MAFSRGARTGDPERDIAYERDFGRRGCWSPVFICKHHILGSYSDLDVPEEVVQYLQYFKRMIDEQNVPEIQGLYEHGFPDLTERIFSEKLWPDDRVVESIVGAGTLLNNKGLMMGAFSVGKRLDKSIKPVLDRSHLKTAKKVAFSPVWPSVYKFLTATVYTYFFNKKF